MYNIIMQVNLYAFSSHYLQRFLNQDDWRNWQTWQVSVDMIEQETGLDFFAELPNEIEKALEERITNLSRSDLRPVTNFPLFPSLPNEGEDDNFFDASLQAPLLADPQEIVSLPIVVGVDNSSVVQHETVNRSPAEIDRVNVFSSSDIGMKGQNSSDFSIEQVSPSHISAIQHGVIQNSFSQVSLTQVSIGEVATAQHSTGQVGITQVGSSQINPFQVSFGQIGSTEINLTQIGSDALTVGFVIGMNVKTTTDSTQISSPEIDPAKIPLSSFVSSNQFFTVHNSPFASINTYKDNPLNLWQTLFNPTNPFDLTFQIENLPTGQLAQAEIRGERRR